MEPEVRTALAHRFALGAVIACEPIAEGLMNPNWKLTTGSGVYAVKRLRDAGPDEVRRQHAVLPQLAARGVPVPPTRTTRDGDSLAEIDGGWYAVAGWLPGIHRGGPELSVAACRALGDLVGRIHAGLRELLPAPRSLADEPRTVAEVLAELDRLGEAAAAGSDDFDRFATAEIAYRKGLLREIGHRRPPFDPAVRPVGWTHGDLNDLNLLFRGETVSGVLDWDRLAVRPYGLEVVRTVTLLFAIGARGVDLRRTAAFAAGYRDRFEIVGEALRDAAHRRWWTLVTDTWFLKLHYDRGDRSCDHLLGRSSTLLRWWTDHRDALDAALICRFSLDLAPSHASIDPAPQSSTPAR
jgi:Ser/Thr protein kinase RdoA (MazF antagonist)